MLWFQCRIWTIPKKFDSGDILINMLFSLAYIATKGWPQPNILATGSSVVATAGMAGKNHVIGVSVYLVMLQTRAEKALSPSTSFFSPCSFSQNH